MGNSETFSIGSLADRAGVRVETIRYYERIGLIPAPRRSKGNQRLYTAEHASRLDFIRRARDLNFSIKNITLMLGLSQQPPTCDRVKSLTESHLQAVRSQIAELQGVEAVLSSFVEACSGGNTTDCVIVQSLEAAPKGRCVGAASKGLQE